MDMKEILGEELYNQVQEKLKDSNLSLEGKIPYDRFNEVNNKKTELASQVSNLSAQIEQLKQENSNLRNSLSAQNITSKIDDILRSNGARKIDTLKKILDISNVQDTEESLNTFKESVLKLKQDEPYLFSTNEVHGNLPQGDNGGKRISKEDFNKMSYSEKVKLYNRDKSLYDILKGEN